MPHDEMFSSRLASLFRIGNMHVCVVSGLACRWFLAWYSPMLSFNVQFSKVASLVEHVPYEVSKVNIRCHSVDLVKQ